MSYDIKTFLELVQINSETKYEQQIGAWLVDRLQALNCQVMVDESAEITGHGFGNILAVLEATDSTKIPLLLLAHMDTVVPGNNIHPIVTDGIIHTDGTTILGADDKAGIAVILDILAYLNQNNIPHGRLEILITAGEESGLVGAKAFDTSVLQAQYGFALDATGNVGEIVIAAPAQVHFNLTINGKTAHAGLEPEKGRNAIYILSQIISHLPNSRIDEETTLNYGLITGGNGATNIVQEQAQVLFEIRSRNEQKLEQLVDTINQTVDKICEEFEVTYELQRQDKYGLFNFEPTHPMIIHAQKCAHSIGLSGHLEVTGGGSDANILSGKGIPTSVLAVGYEYIHTTNERIAISEIEKLFNLVLEIIKQA